MIAFSYLSPLQSVGGGVVPCVYTAGARVVTAGPGPWKQGREGGSEHRQPGHLPEHASARPSQLQEHGGPYLQTQEAYLTNIALIFYAALTTSY